MLLNKVNFVCNTIIIIIKKFYLYFSLSLRWKKAQKVMLLKVSTFNIFLQNIYRFQRNNLKYTSVIPASESKVLWMNFCCCVGHVVM